MTLRLYAGGVGESITQMEHIWFDEEKIKHKGHKGHEGF